MNLLLFYEYCLLCEESFDTVGDAERHLRSRHAICEPCRLVYRNEQTLKDHWAESAHHHYCRDCDRHFQSANNLRTHMDSSVHVAKTISCPFGLLGCDRHFVSYGAMVLHLEGGGCVSGIGGYSIRNAVLRLDRKRHITIQEDHLRAKTSSNPPNNPPFTTPSRSNQHSSGSTTIITNIPKSKAVRCVVCSRKFATHKQLVAHMKSPAHAPKLFICRAGGCLLRFNTLAGLIQHLESAACDPAGSALHRIMKMVRSICSEFATLIR